MAKRNIIKVSINSGPRGPGSIENHFDWTPNCSWFKLGNTTAHSSAYFGPLAYCLLLVQLSFSGALSLFMAFTNFINPMTIVLNLFWKTAVFVVLLFFLSHPLHIFNANLVLFQSSAADASARISSPTVSDCSVMGREGTPFPTSNFAL